MNKKSFLVYFDWYEPISAFSDKDLGELMRAMFEYAKDQTEPEFSSLPLKMVFGFIKSALDRDRAAYEEKCRKNAENGSKGGKKKAEAQESSVNIFDTKALTEDLRRRRMGDAYVPLE